MHVSSGSTSGAYLHSASKDNGFVHGFLLLSAELTRRLRTGLSKVRPRLAALRGVLGVVNTAEYSVVVNTMEAVVCVAVLWVSHVVAMLWHSHAVAPNYMMRMKT